MMILRLALSSAIFLSMNATASEFIFQKDHAELVYSSCVYGRGASVIERAQVQANTQAVEAYRTAYAALTSRQVKEYEAQLWDVAGFEQAHGNGEFTVTLGESFLQGSESCVSAVLPLNNTSDHGENWIWHDEALEASFRIEAVGHASSSMTAIHTAQNNAFELAVMQAISQLVVDAQPYQSLARAHQAFIKDWTLLDQINHTGKTDNADQITVLMNVDIDVVALKQFIDDDYYLAGKPRFFIYAESDQVTSSLATMISELGYITSLRADNADIIIKASSKLIPLEDTAQLSLNMQLLDRLSQQLSHWANVPQMITLPNSDVVESRLVAVNLELAQDEIAVSVEQALQHITTLGGKVVTIDMPALTPAKLAGLTEWLRSESLFSEATVMNQQDKVQVEFRTLLDTQLLAQTYVPRIEQAIDRGLSMSSISNNKLILK
ncbi:hypothetical protein [Vibrio sp. 10N.261.51.F12]|uniref:hypothetical protein n=1 Tax=Vibrio sp. 10N.261.51.F12 TaxID=3229679 RepID=UPI00354B1F0C